MENTNGEPPRPDRLRRTSRQIYLVLAFGFTTAVVLQVFLAGAGVLSHSSYLVHHVRFVEWFQPIPLFLFGAALLGRMSRTAKILPILAFLALVLQYEFIGLRPHLLAGLHTVNALAIFALGAWMVQQGRAPHESRALSGSIGLDPEP